MGVATACSPPKRPSLPAFSSCAMAPIFVKTTSGSYEIDGDASATIAAFLEKAKAKHKMPSWADDVLLRLEGADEDLAEDKTKTLESVGIGGGSVRRTRGFRFRHTGRYEVLPACV